MENICEECNNTYTYNLVDFGIKINSTICINCYRKYLKPTSCKTTRKKLCDKDCFTCFNRSLASHDKVFYVNLGKLDEMKLQLPRYMCKLSGKKYPFIGECGHFIVKSLDTIIGKVTWCSDKKCIQNRTKNTNMKIYGVENVFQNSDIKEKIKSVILEKYQVDNPMKSDKIKEKVRNTNLERYNVACVFHNEEIREKIKNTNLERYNVEYALQSKEIREKIKNTNLERYNVENPFQSEEIREKIKITNLEKYETDSPMKNDKVKQKVRDTNLKIYGVKCVFQSDEIKEKIKQTNLRKYNTENPMQNPDIWHKQQMSAFLYKPYTFPNGRQVLVQGYENWALDILINMYPESDIKTCSEHKLCIDYVYDDEYHKYFPDIYISSNNLIIEVKSDYTYESREDINLAKAKACVNAGYKFQFYIFNKDEELDIHDIYK